MCIVKPCFIAKLNASAIRGGRSVVVANLVFEIAICKILFLIISSSAANRAAQLEQLLVENLESTRL